MLLISYLLTLFRMGGVNFTPPLICILNNEKLEQAEGLFFFFSEPNLVVNISRKFQVHKWSGSQVTGTLSGGTYIFLMKYERKREKLLFYLLLLCYKAFIYAYYFYYANLQLISYHLRGHSRNLNYWNLGI